VRNIFRSNRYAAADRFVNRFGGEIRQHLLVAQVGRLLEHQLILQEEAVIYRQDDLANVLVLILYAEAVFAMPDLRKNSEVP
jgi:hypothetical protein